MNVLFARAGALGDLLLLRRAVAACRYAGHRVSVLAPPGGAALVGSGPSEVTRRLPFEGSETAALLAGETTEGPLRTALQEADLVVAYTRSASLAQALQDRTRHLVTHDPSPPEAGPHASVWLARGARALGAALAPHPIPVPDLVFSDEETHAAAPWLARLPAGFLAIHAGSGSPRKNWPSARFLALAQQLDRERPWLLVSGPAEGERDPVPARAVVARELPLRVLGALLSRAGVFVGNDSGVSHLAAASGAPTLALFGPTDPRLWSPLGRRVRVLRGRECRIETIELPQVLEEIAALGAT